MAEHSNIISGHGASVGGERAGPRVLVVDDDASLRTTLERGLRLEGFDVGLAVDGATAIDLVDSWHPDVIVLDVSMPGIDGVEVCRRLRLAGVDTPICMLSARDEVADRVGGIRAGADDYMVKPFALIELEARLEALLRRRPQARLQLIDVGDLVIDPAQRRVTRAGRPIELTRREFDLLETLAANVDIVLSRERLLDLVWGYRFETSTNVVDVFVGYLRRKLEAEGQGRMIHTVRGVGFVLRP